MRGLGRSFMDSIDQFQYPLRCCALLPRATVVGVPINNMMVFRTFNQFYSDPDAVESHACWGAEAFLCWKLPQHVGVQIGEKLGPVRRRGKYHSAPYKLILDLQFFCTVFMAE